MEGWLPLAQGGVEGAATGVVEAARERLSAQWLSPELIILALSIFGLLCVSLIVGWILSRQPDSVVRPAMIERFNSRVMAWLVMLSVLAFAYIFQAQVAVTVLFFFVSFWALREFITLTPTRLADHRALFWVFVAICPAQFVLVGMGHDWYWLYSILIPVYGFLFVPARVALSGDPKNYLERTAKIQAALMICVYCLSYAPALLYLRDVRDSTGAVWEAERLGGLLFYFILMVQLSDLFQYFGDVWIGGEPIVPDVNARKTLEGLIVGSLLAAVAGMGLWWITPFNFWQSGLMSLVIAVMCFCGRMTMSAIKRDRGVSDYGTLVQGHVGVLDRLDSLCFAAPVFFHLVQRIFANQPVAAP